MAERKVQTITRAIKMFVADPEQRDWDEYAERLVFALNTLLDTTRQDTPFFLVHGWDPKTTVEAMIGVGEHRGRDPDARRWRLGIQRAHTYARRHATALLQEAMESRAEQANQGASATPGIQVGTRVWVFIERVKEGCAKKLAHLWHGPFRVAELLGDHACRLEILGAEYRIFPIVHVARLKVCKNPSERPLVRLRVDPAERIDFDEALLPSDSWAPEEADGEFEIVKILDMRITQPTRSSRKRRQYLVQWKQEGSQPSWVDEEDISYGGLLFDFHRENRARHRLEMMALEATE